MELTRFRRRCWGERKKEAPMPRTHPPYAPEYRRRIIELARAGRPIAQLAREFEASANAIRKWVKQAGLDEGLRRDGLTTAEREELNRLRRENRVLREERARYYQKPRPGSRRRPARCRHGVPIRERESGHVHSCHDVPGAGRLRQRLLCVAPAAAISTGARRRGTHVAHQRDSSILARNLRRAADSRGTISGWHACRTQAGRALDEGRRPLGSEPPPMGNYHGARARARPAP